MQFNKEERIATWKWAVEYKTRVLIVLALGFAIGAIVL